MRILGLLALSAASAFAGNGAKFGLDAQAGLVLPSIGSNITQTTATNGFDGLFNGTVDFPLNQKLGLRFGLGFEYQTWGYKVPFMSLNELGVPYTITYDNSVSEQSIELSVAPVYRVGDKGYLKAGYSFNLPIGGTVKSSVAGLGSFLGGFSSESKNIGLAGNKPDSTKADFKAVHSVFVGGGFRIGRELYLDGTLTLGVTGVLPREVTDIKTGEVSYDGTASRANNIVLNRVNVGIHYDFKM